MGMPDVLKRWTREEVLALPDNGNRYELVHGELLVSPGPRPVHQLAVAALFRRVDPYVRAHRLGTTLTAPADLDLGAGHLVQPDLFVLAWRQGPPPADWLDVGVPRLIAEVLSPSTARFDRATKRALYQERAVADYWIVDPDARLVEHWRPSDERPAVLDQRLEWQPDAGLPPLVIDLGEYFREVWGDE